MPIDYSALAKQAGAVSSEPAAGGVDYSALAKQAGATSSQPAAAVLDPSGAPAQNPDGAVSRFLHSAWEQLNPLPAIREYMNRPDEAGKVSRAFAAGMRIHAGKEQPGDRALLEEGMKANLGATAANPPIVPPGTEALVDAGSKAQQGNLAGAAGTLTGAAIPLAAGAALGGEKAPAATAAPETRGLAQRLYQGALNPRITTPAAEVRAMVDTGLENKIPVSEAGAAKLSSLLADLNQKLQDRVQPATMRGGAIDPSKVVVRLNDVERRFGAQVNPEADLKAIDKSGDEFLRTQGAAPGSAAVPPKATGILDPNGRPIMDAGKPEVPATRAQPIPLDRAQQLKVGTYQKLAGKYGDVATDAQVEAQKALARGIKEELNVQLPELGDLNAREAKLFDLQGPLETAVAKAANQSGKGPGFPTVVTSGVVGGLSGSAPLGVGAGILKSVLADPAVRSRLAIAINRAQQNNPAKWGPANLQAATARVSKFAAALSASQGATEQPQQ